MSILIRSILVMALDHSSVNTLYILLLLYSLLHYTLLSYSDYSMMRGISYIQRLVQDLVGLTFILLDWLNYIYNSPWLYLMYFGVNSEVYSEFSWTFQMELLCTLHSSLLVQYPSQGWLHLWVDTEYASHLLSCFKLLVY